MKEEVGVYIEHSLTKDLQKLFPDEKFKTKRIGEFVIIYHTVDFPALSALDNIEVLNIYRKHVNDIANVTTIYDEELEKEKQEENEKNE